jgi:hypothetical protein
MLCYDFLQRVGHWLTTTWYGFTFCSCNEYVSKHLHGKCGYLWNFTLTYQQYHGGTNFGRTGASYVLTGYYDEAPMDEYGQIDSVDHDISVFLS